MGKKFIRLAITIMFTLTCVFILETNSCLATDSKAPEITAVRVSSDDVTRPGVVTVEIDVHGEDCGIVEAGAVVNRTAYDAGGGSSNDRVGEHWEGKSIYDGTIKIDIPISSEAELGLWHVSNVWIYDSVGKGQTLNSFGSIDSDLDYYCYFRINGAYVLNPTFTVKDEFEYDSKVALSNPKLLSRIAAMDEGKTMGIVIDDDSNGILPKAAFDSIKGLDKRIVAYKDGYQWVFYGKDIDNETKDIDLRVKVKMVQGEEFLTNQNAVNVIFANNGILPCTTQFRLKSDYLYKLNQITGRMYLYYIRNGVPELEANPNFDLAFDGTDKWCYFDVNHNSSFVVTGSKVKSAKVVNTAIKKVTGKKKAFVISWAKKNYTGYQLRYSLKSSMKKAKTISIGKPSTTSKKITKIKSKKKYYIQIRTYKKLNGKNYYSSWSKKKAIKTK